MIQEYIESSMEQAVYEILEDGQVYAEISILEGVWAVGETLEECKKELYEVVEGWILLGIKLNHEIPIINGIDLNIRMINSA